MSETCGGSGTHNKAIVLRGTVKPKQTNADRIRGMSDEELADELLSLFAAFYDIEWSLEAVLDWLREEAKT